MTTTSESLLFRLKQDGDSPDEFAWQQFVSIYTPLIFFWARKTGLGQADASDLVQEVLTQVFRKLPDFNYDGRSFRGWLRTVTLNKYREVYRRKSARLATASDSILENLQPIAAAESTWDIDYAKLLVAQAMEGMKSDFAPETWNALKLVMGSGLSVDDAATQTGVSTWTIYSARARLMKRLRADLAGLL